MAITITIRYGTDHIDWAAVCEIIRQAPLGTRDPETLKIAAENSHTVCTAYAQEVPVGFGRALSDGHLQSAVYDVVVLPDYQGRGVGRMIMEALLAKLPRKGPVLLYAAPGKVAFYRKHGFGMLKTGMARFPDPERYRAGGYLD
jgi:ribosomal protein S18 acetylase RimI-like enzyme